MRIPGPVCGETLHIRTGLLGCMPCPMPSITLINRRRSPKSGALLPAMFGSASSSRLRLFVANKTARKTKMSRPRSGRQPISQARKSQLSTRGDRAKVQCACVLQLFGLKGRIRIQKAVPALWFHLAATQLSRRYLDFLRQREQPRKEAVCLTLRYILGIGPIRERMTSIRYPPNSLPERRLVQVVHHHTPCHHP